MTGSVEKARVGGPAQGPGYGGPAKGSWPPFEEGNTAALTHGAYATLQLRPRAAEIAERLSDAMGDALEPKHAPAIEGASLAAARVERARAQAGSDDRAREEAAPAGDRFVRSRRAETRFARGKVEQELERVKYALACQRIEVDEAAMSATTTPTLGDAIAARLEDAGPASASELARSLHRRKRDVLDVLRTDPRFTGTGAGRRSKWALAAAMHWEPVREPLHAPALRASVNGSSENAGAAEAHTARWSWERVPPSKCSDPVGHDGARARYTLADVR